MTGVKPEISRLTNARSAGTASVSRGSSAAAASDASAVAGARWAGAAPGSPTMAKASAVSACGPAAWPFTCSR